MTATSPCRTSTCTASPSSRTRSGETSSRISTTPSHSSSGPRREPACCRLRAFVSTCATAAATGARSRSTVLILAFDTATSVATVALVDGDTVFDEGTTAPVRVLETIDYVLLNAGVEPEQLDGLAVGIGPGSFTGIRMGLAVARALAFSLDLPVAGMSTLAAGAPDALPLIDAKRREVFLEQDGEIVAVPAAAFEAPGRVCVGDGALRYREHLAGTGAMVPPDESELHLPRARFHAALAEKFGAADELRPVYVRAPDADRMLA